MNHESFRSELDPPPAKPVGSIGGPTASLDIQTVAGHRHENVNYHDASPWAMVPVRRRCQIVGSVAAEIASHCDSLIAASRNRQRFEDIETVASELIPLCDALRWIAKKGPSTLKNRVVGTVGRPLWMWGVRSVVQRRALGRVLILGTWNYPVFLSGVQTAQALAAGNTVLLKPAPGSESVTADLIAAFHRAFDQAGVDHDVLRMIDSSAEAARAAIREGVDLVVLTGSEATGRKVLASTAEMLTPAIMELSGVDGVAVLPGADQNRVIAAVEFGLMFNSGATCIGPRRLFLQKDSASQSLIENLVGALRRRSRVCVHENARNGVADVVADAIRQGARDLIGRFEEQELRETGNMAPVVLTDVPEQHPILRSDLFAPVLSIVEVENENEIVRQFNACPYRLSASVFGPRGDAERLASRLQVGCVVVNDMIAPTADPRLPFGGRGKSGFGVTRGPEGLLAMTTPQVIATRTSRWAPHLSERNDSDAELLTGVLQFKHASGFRARIAGFKRLTTAAWKPRGLKH